MAVVGWRIVDGWWSGWRVGRDLLFDAAIAGRRVLWCTHLAALGCCNGGVILLGLLLVKREVAALVTFLEAMMLFKNEFWKV